MAAQAIVGPSVYGSPKLGTFFSTLGPRSEQNPYSGELAAMEQALGTLPTLRSSRIEISIRNKAAVLTLRQPRQQSGQHHVHLLLCTLQLSQPSQPLVAEGRSWQAPSVLTRFVTSIHPSICLSGQTQTNLHTGKRLPAVKSYLAVKIPRDCASVKKCPSRREAKLGDGIRHDRLSYKPPRRPTEPTNALANPPDTTTSHCPGPTTCCASAVDGLRPSTYWLAVFCGPGLSGLVRRLARARSSAAMALP
jgi:hypothetical protein